MKKMALKHRVTLLCGMILIGMSVALTIISVYNAKNTYTNQFNLNLGDIFSLSIDGNGTTFGGVGGEQINKALDIAKQFIPSGIQEQIFGSQSSDPVTNFLQGAERKFTAQSVVIAAAFVIVGILLIYYVTDKALKPVKQLGDSVRRINENNLYEKLEVPGTKDEIASLTTSYNQMLDRLSSSFAIQKNFAANAAHELRTPLATTRAGIQVLEMEEEPSLEDYKEAVEIVKESNERLIQIVDNLLVLTRETKESFTDIVPMEKLLQELEEELKEASLNYGTSLRIIQREGTIRGNRTLIYRAIYNLMENGLKYCGTGGEVAVESKLSGNQVLITISDNGPGIPSDSLKHIFEPFYRVDKSRSRAVGGSGLGLSIVKGIIDKHNGQIVVESIEGKGTVVTVVFEGIKESR